MCCWGAGAPQLSNMAIVLWIAQLLLDYIKSANNILHSEMEHQVRRSLELQASLVGLKELNNLYEESIKSLGDSADRLSAKLSKIKSETEQLKVERHRALEHYNQMLDEASADEILRAKI